MGSLGDGFKVLRALADSVPVATPERPLTPREMFTRDLAYEAQKFIIYRAWKLRDRQALSLNRIRSIAEMLRGMKS